ncbi:MAG: LacI family transcriptional regulator [Xylanivirga thermophila]|jgi:LacI family transcriptional regulator|uniref:LacI family DNA-binding transcriptional regulator n=1 Tax=Xylanivirga thermophila TaxID=2496273 RepID=UPI0039F458E9
MSTIKDVAKMAGVSASTVSRALSGKVPVDEATKQKVFAAVKALNYEPNPLAKSLKEGKTNTIGLIMPNIRNPVFPAVARGVEDIAREHGYTVVLCNTDEQLNVEIDYIEKLKKRWVDGFIFATAGKADDHILDLKDQGIPVVLLIRNIEDEIDAVVVDNFSAAYKATKYLIGLGHKDIAIVNGDSSLKLYKDRFKGYKHAMEEAGISIDDKFILQDIESTSQAYETVSNLLKSKNMPTAVFATSDPKAYGVIRAILDFGLDVPGDISVMGFDDLELSAFINPPLTTMAQPWYQMGARAMERLIEVMEGKEKIQPKVDVMDVKLVARKSTGEKS